MTRQLAQALGLGDIGKPGASKRSLCFDTSAQDWRCIYALLELARATDDRSFLKLAGRIADNLLATPDQDRAVSAPGPSCMPEPATRFRWRILHLAAALDGRESLLPPPMLDNAFFHCQFDGSMGSKEPEH